MKAGLRLLLFALCAGGAFAVQAQRHRPAKPPPLTVIGSTNLEDGRTDGYNDGRIQPGVDLREDGQARCHAGDDPGSADRALNDTAWRVLEAGKALDTAQVQWVRFHVMMDSTAKGLPVMLDVGSDAALHVFLNGRPVLQLDAPPATGTNIAAERKEVAQSVTVPLLFACDGKAEVLAIRCDRGTAGASAPTLRAVLHAWDSGALAERSSLHFGLFIGVNLFIFILAVVIYSLDRRERSWLLLAVLSLVTAVTAFCDVGDDVGLGLSGGMLRVLTIGQVVLFPWPMFLLILVLRQLRGGLSRRAVIFYSAVTLLLTAIGTSFVVLGLFASSDGSDTVRLQLSGSLGLLLTAVLLALAFGGLTLVLAVEVVRHSVVVMRASGHGRWIGGGALVSSLLSVVLQFTSAVAGLPGSSWLSIASQYCAYVALPLSVAIYLAVRAARNNKLVARQRDELDQEVQDRTAELRHEKERSDELLLNILPEEVADELKLTGSAAAKHFDSATILFTDFKDFTMASERLSPEELVEELNTCFKAFDQIVSARGIEKIKTIGDAYMCAGGLPDPRSSTPVDVVHAALEMQAFMKERKTERVASGRPAFDMRVGIHTGPVVAGIVGLKKFQYDIWGDTVNTASRLESSGEVGRVNISQHTHALVQDAPGLRFMPRGKVNAKGKGELEMYYVEEAGSGRG